jgi:L-alanine-DL-glutamate epimerase-like enolase superfamily enzyme
MDVAGAFDAMVKAIRNSGRPGAVGDAISAVDVALWDLKARLLEQPLFRLLGAVRTDVRSMAAADSSATPRLSCGSNSVIGPSNSASHE